MQIAKEKCEKRSSKKEKRKKEAQNDIKKTYSNIIIRDANSYLFFQLEAVDKSLGFE